MEVASTAIIGGLTLKALYALSKAVQNYFIQPKARELVNKAYQKVTKKDKKLWKRKLDEDDLEFLQAQIDDVYLLLEFLWDETKNPDVGKSFLKELQKSVSGLKIDFDEQLSRVRILEERTNTLEDMIFHRFEVVYGALEDIFAIINSYDNRISRLELKMDKIEKRIEEIEKSQLSQPKINRPLIPAITMEFASDPKNNNVTERLISEKEYGKISQEVGFFQGTENEFEIAVELGREVLEAYIYGAITFYEAVNTLETFKENLRRGYQKTRDVIKIRELLYLIDAIKEQIQVLQETKTTKTEEKYVEEKKVKERKQNPLLA